jgi:hypothetical protein
VGVVVGGSGSAGAVGEVDSCWGLDGDGTVPLVGVAGSPEEAGVGGLPEDAGGSPADAGVGVGATGVGLADSGVGVAEVGVAWPVAWPPPVAAAGRCVVSLVTWVSCDVVGAGLVGLVTGVAADTGRVGAADVARVLAFVESILAARGA